MINGVVKATKITRSVPLQKIKKLINNTNGKIPIFCMTATGLYDYHTILVRNSPKNNLEYDLNDELLCWIHENTTSKDVFLTANYYLNNMLLGGAISALLCCIVCA